jgi:hypothetical protein
MNREPRHRVEPERRKQRNLAQTRDRVKAGCPRLDREVAIDDPGNAMLPAERNVEREPLGVVEFYMGRRTVE